MPQLFRVPVEVPQPKLTNKEATNNNFTSSVKLSIGSQRLVSQQLRNDYNDVPLHSLRLRYLLLDLAYYMENSEHLKQTNASRVITSLYKELELPVLQPNIDAALAYLVGVFLSSKPIFATAWSDITNEDARKIAEQMDAIIAENARMTGWSRQMTKWFKNGLKYNVAALEVEWITKTGFKFTTDPQISITEAVVNHAMRSGNELKNLNMYNTFFDTRVSPGDIHKDGDFVGYVEKISFAKLHRYIQDLRVAGKRVMNVDTKLWGSSPMHNWYYEAKIVTDIVLSSGTDWVSFFDTHITPMESGQKQYERVTFYRRVIPSMFGIQDVPDKDKVQVWKFVEINGIIILAERRTNAHDMIPIIFMQPIEDDHGLQTKGLGSNLLPFQSLSGTMMRARLASLARALSDRALYNPTMISEKNVNSQVPTAKIPVRPNAYGGKISDAYYPIPYDDRNGQMLYQDIAQVHRWGEDAAHINRADRGQFTKGNRTLGEYSDIQSNADASQQAMAIIIEDQAIVYIKYIVKINILQYQTNTTLVAPNNTESVEIEPDKLRDAIVEFKLADGLTPKDQIMGVRETIETFGIMAQDPEARTRYDLTRMLVDALSLTGSNIRLYAIPPAPIDDQGNRVPQSAAEAPSVPIE